MGLINFTYDFNAGSKTCSWCVRKLPKTKKFWCSVKCCNAEMDYAISNIKSATGTCSSKKAQSNRQITAWQVMKSVPVT